MKAFCLEVSGPFACFTRPEMKVERVSYDVMTPSAARAVFEAILWKPAIQWRVRRVEVLRPIRWINLRRNEVSAVASTRAAQQAMAVGKGSLGISVEEERQQRAGLFLRDVAYRVHAEMALTEVGGDAAEFGKYAAIFERRAAKGQCVNQPYLGCREFAADFRLIEDPVASSPPLGESRQLGWMLHDMDFSDPIDPKPRFFNAQMVAGVIEVPTLAEARG